MYNCHTQNQIYLRPTAYYTINNLCYYSAIYELIYFVNDNQYVPNGLVTPNWKPYAR